MARSTCQIQGCTSPVRARGWCNKHYRRWKRTGDPSTAAWERGDPVANFWAKVARGGAAECWRWAGCIAQDGYGRFQSAAGQMAHRFAYSLAYGPLPEGADVDHMCHNLDTSCAGGPACPHRRCVNPMHLRAIPVRANRQIVRRGAVGEHLGAIQRAKTHCPQGHPYDEANTYVDKRGSRNCRACRRETARAADRTEYHRSYYLKRKTS